MTIKMHNVILAWKNLRARKKQTARIIVLFSVAMCLLVGTTLVERGVTEFIDYIMKEVPDSRTLIGESMTEKGAGNIEKYYSKDERVLDVIITGRRYIIGTFENAMELADEETRAELNINPYHEGIGDYTDYERELQSGEVLIPRYFNPDVLQGSDNMLTYEMKFIDTADWVGREITTKVNCTSIDMDGNMELHDEQVEVTLKIVGTYDNVQMCEYRDVLYVSKETFSDIDDASMDEYSKDRARNMSVILVAKSQADVEELETETGLEALVDGRDENQFYEFFISGLKAGAIFLFAIAIINVVLTLTEEIRERRSEIALLRAMGYENGRIAMMLLWELIMIIGIVVVAVLAASVLFVLAGNWFIGKFIGTAYQNITICFEALYVVSVIGVSIMAMLATFAVAYYKMEQVNTVEALKEE